MCLHSIQAAVYHIGSVTVAWIFVLSQCPPSADVAPPSSARAEAILSFLEPHLLPEQSDGQAQTAAWSWSEWRGRVQRWAGWPPPEPASSDGPVSRPRQEEDRSRDQPPTAALWHRFIGRAALDKTQTGEQAESTAAATGDTSDRCELLKRDLLHSLSGLGDMLRRDGSGCSFYSIESDSLQDKWEPSEAAGPLLVAELSEEAARHEAQAMMAAGVGRQSSSESEPGCRVPPVRRCSSSDSSDRTDAELSAATAEHHRPAQQHSVESTEGGPERCPPPPRPVQVTLEARCSFETVADRIQGSLCGQERQLQLAVAARVSCESADSVASDTSMATACDRLPASDPPGQSGDTALRPLVQAETRAGRTGRTAARPLNITYTMSSSSDSEGSDSCVQLTARRADEYQRDTETTEAYIVERNVFRSETQNETEIHPDVMKFAKFDEQRTLKMNVKDTWCSVSEFSFDKREKFSTAFRNSSERQQSECLSNVRHTVGGPLERDRVRGSSVSDSTAPVERPAAGWDPSPPHTRIPAPRRPPVSSVSRRTGATEERPLPGRRIADVQWAQ